MKKIVLQVFSVKSNIVFPEHNLKKFSLKKFGAFSLNFPEKPFDLLNLPWNCLKFHCYQDCGEGAE